MAPAPTIQIRPIRPADREALVRAHGGMSEETVRRRYLAPKPRLLQRELTYLTDVDGVHHVALVAVRDDEIVGVARFVRLADDPETAEAAVVVTDAEQGRGLGRRLGAELADAARARGVRRFVATMLSDNVAAHRLLHRMDARLRRTPGIGLAA